MSCCDKQAANVIGDPWRFDETLRDSEDSSKLNASQTGLSPNRRDISADHPGQLCYSPTDPRKQFPIPLFLQLRRARERAAGELCRGRQAVRGSGRRRQLALRLPPGRRGGGFRTGGLMAYRVQSVVLLCRLFMACKERGT